MGRHYSTPAPRDGGFSYTHLRAICRTPEMGFASPSIFRLGLHPICRVEWGWQQHDNGNGTSDSTGGWNGDASGDGDDKCWSLPVSFYNSFRIIVVKVVKLQHFTWGDLVWNKCFRHITCTYLGSLGSCRILLDKLTSKDIGFKTCIGVMPCLLARRQSSPSRKNNHVKSNIPSYQIK